MMYVYLNQILKEKSINRYTILASLISAYIFELRTYRALIHPERRDELITIRRDMWQNSGYYTEISEALGFGG